MTQKRRIRATLEGDILDGALYFENEDGSELDDEAADNLARLFNNNPERLMWLKMQPGQTVILEETVNPSESSPPPPPSLADFSP